MTRERTVARDAWYPLRLLSGWGLLGTGVLVLPLPIPLGLIMMAAGVGLLARDSRFIRRRLMLLGRRYPKVRERLVAAAGRVSSRLAGYLRRLLGRSAR